MFRYLAFLLLVATPSFAAGNCAPVKVVEDTMRQLEMVPFVSYLDDKGWPVTVFVNDKDKKVVVILNPDHETGCIVSTGQDFHFAGEPNV